MIKYPIPQFLLNNSVTVTPYTGSSAYGPIYGIAFTAKCRFEPTDELKVDADGRELKTKGRLFFNLGENVTPESKVLFEGTTYRVITVVNHPESHLEVYIA
jgi:hypothetical protein